MSCFRRIAIHVTALIALAIGSTMSAAAAPACSGRDLLEQVKEQQPEDYQLILQRAAKVPNGEGTLWKVERAGLEPSYLFGTIHLTDDRLTNLAQPVRDALAQVDTVAVESLEAVDPAQMRKMMADNLNLLLLNDGSTLISLLDDDARATVRTALSERGVDLALVSAMKPWMVAVSLAMPACEATRQQEELPFVDRVVAELAKGSGKKLIGLESAQEQFEALNSIPLDVQLEMLVSTAAMSALSEDSFATMAALYRTGQIALINEIARLFGERNGMASETFDAFNRPLIDTRNHRMAERATPYLDKGGTLIAVGALHMPGEQGLVELLRQQGFTVSRVY